MRSSFTVVLALIFSIAMGGSGQLLGGLGYSCVGSGRRQQCLLMSLGNSSTSLCLQFGHGASLAQKYSSKVHKHVRRPIAGTQRENCLQVATKSMMTTATMPGSKKLQNLLWKRQAHSHTHLLCAGAAGLFSLSVRMKSLGPSSPHIYSL